MNEEFLDMLRYRLIPVFSLVAIECGCATIEGKWSLTKVDPTAARCDSAFTSLTLQEDGTFYAEAHEFGETESVSGTWSLENRVLSLEQQEGEQHTCDAETEGTGALRPVRHQDGRRVTAVIERRASWPR
jgi:hypothetical protein